MMSKTGFGRLFSGAFVVVGSSVVVLMGGIARADSAPVPNPGVPGLVPAGMPQVLQNVTSALTGAPAAPATTPPLASGMINLPQPASVSQPQPASGVNSLLPSAQINLPKIPSFPMLLPQQLSLPSDLTALLGGPTAAASVATAAVPNVGRPGLTGLLPFSALP